MNIGEVIVNLRKQKGIKQNELAKEMNITPTYLSLIETNQRQPGVGLLSNIANYFDLPITALLFMAIAPSDIDSIQQKKYINAATPIVEALVSYMLRGESTTKGKDLLAGIKRRSRKASA